MKKNLFFVWSFFLATLFFASCASNQIEKNYTEEELLLSNLETIQKSIGENPVKTLYDFILLEEKQIENLLWEENLELVSSIENQILEEIKNQTEKYIAEKNFYQAKINVESLQTVLDFGIQFENQLSWMEDVKNQIDTWITSEIEAFLVKNQEKNPTVPEMITGTVTVWVDKGLRIEKGLGYSDISIGSGFFIDERGYIVTNYHVIESEVDPEYEGYSRLYIKTSKDSETKVPAKVIGYDSVMDLALLKTEITPDFVFQLGSSENLEIGDQIYAIGSPLGLEKTITSGIISTTDRKITTLGTVMQLDASVNAGNSGGPAVSKEGLVQGVVFAGITGSQGLNFAIPVEYLKNELFALYNGGEVFHPWLGIYGKTYKNPETQEETGVEILYIIPGTSGSYQEIKAGNLIIGINGKSIKNENQLQNVLIGFGSNRITAIRFLDLETNEEKTELVFLEKRPEYPGEIILAATSEYGAFLPLFGMELVPMSSDFKKEFLVTKVVKGSVADNAGFSENDPIKIVRSKVIEDGQYFYAEVFGKKRKNGYLEATMALTAPMDSSNFF